MLKTAIQPEGRGLDNDSDDRARHQVRLTVRDHTAEHRHRHQSAQDFHGVEFGARDPREPGAVKTIAGPAAPGLFVLTAPIRFQVEQRRPVHAVQSLHAQD